MRVLLWSPKGAGVHYGGAGMSAFRMYSSGEGLGLQVDLAHGFEGQPGHPNAFASEFLISRLFDAKDGEAVGGDRMHWLRQLRFLSSSRAWLRQNARRYSIMHALTGFQYSVTPALMAESFGLPAIVKIATQGRDLADKSVADQLTGRVRRRRDALGRLSGVIAISARIRAELLGYGVPESKIAYIPNGVNVQEFSPAASDADRTGARRALGIEDRFTVLFAGGLVRRKRPEVLIEAISNVRRRGVDLQLVYVGPEHDPSLCAEMKARISALELEGRVHWLGMRRDMSTCYRAADIFCLPSTAEGLSNAVLEALSSGLPVIAEPISGNEDVITPECGVLNGGGAEAYARAIDAYARDERRLAEHSAAARQRIVASFSHEAVLTAHAKLFKSVLAGKPAADASHQTMTTPSVLGALPGGASRGWE